MRAPPASVRPRCPCACAGARPRSACSRVARWVRATRRSRAIRAHAALICAPRRRWEAMHRKSLAVVTQLFFAALGGRLGIPMMVAGYLVVAGFLLAYVSAQVYTNSLMEQVSARKRQETVARERIGVLTARYATITSKSRVSRACEGSLGLVESTTAVVRVAIDGATLAEDPPGETVHIDRVLGSDINGLTQVMRR